MEKLEYNITFSLKEISLKNVPIILWSQPEILASLEEIGVESKVEDNIGKLKLPPKLREQMKYLVKPIGSEIINWKRFHERHLESGKIEMFSFVKQLFWIQSLGVVDYQKTAENLIRLKMFDTIKLYKLACLYCLEEYISVLWEKLPVASKRYFYQKRPLVLTHPKFWPHIFKGMETKHENISYNIRGEPISHCQFAFQLSTSAGNKVATEYFFKKLSFQEREESLFKRTSEVYNGSFSNICLSTDQFPPEKHADNLIYLLSLMLPEQQMEILKSKPSRTLKCLLDSPRQELFLDTAELIWNFLNANDYVILLNIIADKILSGYCFVKKFEEFFLRGSSDFIKEFVESESQCARILDILYKVHLSGTIRLIFRKLDSVSRKRLIFSIGVFNLFVHLFLTGPFYSVRLFLDEATLSEEGKDELKKSFFRNLKHTTIVPGRLKRSIRNQFLLCLN